VESHRWRFAQPDPPLAMNCLFAEEQRIGVAGDWCGGPRVEGAFLSGLSLAERILGRTGVDPGGPAS
jgi:predicted NAD/FAD-dependent oxidoreductase